MTFWTSAALEPKRQYRFLVTLGNMPGGLQFVVKKTTKPKIVVSNTEHNYLNHTFNFPGRVKFDPVTMTVVDAVNPDSGQNLAAALQAGGYVIPRNSTQVTTMSKLGAVTALGTVKIKQISESFVGQINGASGGELQDPSGFSDREIGEGVEVEVWTLNNAWIEEFTPSELDYSSDELSTIELKIRYDWATLETYHGPDAFSAGAGLLNVGEDPFSKKRFSNQ